MKTNKTQMALLIATALLGMAQAHAETITITSQFTPLEDLGAQERAATLAQVEKQNPLGDIDWEKSIVGKNEKGQIEIRDKASLTLMSVIQPTCS